MRTAYYATALVLVTGCTMHVRNGPPPAPPPPPPAAVAEAPAAPAPAPTAAAPTPTAAPPAANTIGGVIGAPATPGFDPLPSNQPPVTEPPPPPNVNPVATPANVANGRPPNLKPGAQAAYWVWRDANGWHVRTTTAKNLHRFHGKVTGDIVNVKPVRTEMNDRMKSTKDWILFAFETAGNLDGFDFTTNGCASFNLHANAGKKIFIGASELQPTTNFFTLCQ